MGTILRNAAAGLRWLLVGVAVATVVAGSCLAVSRVALGAGTHESIDAADRPPVEWSLVSAPGIDRQRAMDAAVAAVPGSRAVSAEFDTEHRVAVWEVEVVTPEGMEVEVTIDAGTGEVLGTVDHD